MPQEGSTFVKNEEAAKTDNKMQSYQGDQIKHLQSIGGELIIECDDVVQDNRHNQVDNSLSNENAFFTQSIIETSNSNGEICAQVKFDKPT